LLVGLTSIFWREAWKYGERAFRYCQHDLGHALGALRLSAARLGWTMHLLTDWSDADVATLLGTDREEDFGDAEREEAECLLLITVNAGPEGPAHAAGERSSWLEGLERARMLEAATHGRWTGRANRLSPSHVAWPPIDAVAAATRYPGDVGRAFRPGIKDLSAIKTDVDPDHSPRVGPLARAIILQRRSAVAFDGRSMLPASVFMQMLARLRPGQPPWDAAEWTPDVHLALFVHRVDGLSPGIYAFLRNPDVAREWQDAMRPQFVWEPQRDAAGHVRDGELYFLLPFDMTWPAMRVSCDQDIAGEGFFSLAMIGRTGLARPSADAWLYRRLFWETGVIGQVLYLEAEAAGARATGIGCFYDDAVHELLGLKNENDEFEARSAEWQSLYHFSMGIPVEDPRLTTEPGYEWERA
jgi:nitroreductase